MKKLFFLLLFIAPAIFCHELQQAEEHYKKGELEKDWQEKQKNFNEALRNYSQMEEEYLPGFGTGKLYYNMANTYYQLGEYPYALYYYNKALDLRPNDSQVLENLQIAQKQMGQEVAHKKRFLALPLWLQLFSLFCFLFFTFWSLFIWFPSTLTKYAALLTLLLAAICLAGILYNRYFAPIEGVMVHASFYYKGPGEQYGKASNEALFSGSKVQVLNIVQNGEWLKVLSEEDRLGYVPSGSIKLLD